ncbi:hypothetical protein [Paracraurococcus lichenis]|uniref:Lectin n=1 Tax=Paracraurococcus lichenis TaxID=3064888 RepID=A0ABT9E5A7_9PROT|nr:hypothetical protein [Paracraurococcus sp. LOR1-02]MDO9711297.1 hypothetical protein [Paracraurococcus sp. LOR1-02]
MIRLTGALAALALAALAGPAMAQQSGPQAMTFFVTSANPGKGADLGGLAGADAYCQSLAQAAGAGNRTWHAYLSSQGANAENARDRIGRGPWRNAKGEVIARDLADLHGEAAGLTKQTALTEKGEVVSGRGDPVNTHDILTGSQPDGTAFAGAEDRTCRNWTSGGEGSAMLGHSDRIGLNDSPPMKSWNSSHPSRGCGIEALRSTGGAGLFYCFATN